MAAAPMPPRIEPICGAELLIRPFKPRSVPGRDKPPNRHRCLGPQLVQLHGTTGRQPCAKARQDRIRLRRCEASTTQRSQQLYERVIRRSLAKRLDAALDRQA